MSCAFCSTPATKTGTSSESSCALRSPASAPRVALAAKALLLWKLNRNKRRSIGLAQPRLPLVELPDSQAMFTTECCCELSIRYLIRYKATPP